MRQTRLFRAAVAAVLLTALPTAGIAESVRIPAGTTVYCVLDESLSTKKKSSNFVRPGDRVRAKVAEDVVIDGRVVIEAGTVVWSEVSKARRAKIAGIRGRLEVDANTVAAVDDTSIRLTGGYDRSGRGRFVTAAVLAKIIAWPFILIKGKHVTAVNGQRIRRIEIHVVDGMGEVDFQELAEHFRLGMNRFTLTAEGPSVDVLLEFEF